MAADNTHAQMANALDLIYADLSFKHNGTSYKHNAAYAQMRYLSGLTSREIAKTVLKLDELELSKMICIPQKNDYHIYLPSCSGIWRLQTGKLHNIHERLNRIAWQVEKRISDKVTDLVESLLKRIAATDDEEASKPLHSKLSLAKGHLKLINGFVMAITEGRRRNDVLKDIILLRAHATEQAGIDATCFNPPGYLGFDDGVYDFASKRLLTGLEAEQHYVTLTVGYGYEDMEMMPADYDSEAYGEWTGITKEQMEETSDFLARIYPIESVRQYVLKAHSDSLQKKMRQQFFVHYNTRGSNGKSTAFNLVKAAVGQLYVKCNPDMVCQRKNGDSKAADPELMSARDVSVLVLSEPDANKRLSVSFLKDFTGGEDLSGRGLFEGKSTFVFRGLPHLLCNKIPELDQTDGGIMRRIRCIPYMSYFDADATCDQPGRNIYQMDTSLANKFGYMKRCLMRKLLDIADEHVTEPPEVRKATTEFRERESPVNEWFNERIRVLDFNHEAHYLNTDDFLTLTQCYDDYKAWCDRESVQAQIKKHFKPELVELMDESRFKDKHKHKSNCWLRYELVVDYD